LTIDAVTNRLDSAVPTSALVNLLYSVSEQVNQRDNPMHALLAHLLADESGVTAVEYGLIAALIAIAAVAILGTVSTNLTSVFSKVSARL
jgi:pilus assembly protein Flp/PilA